MPVTIVFLRPTLITSISSGFLVFSLNCVIFSDSFYRIAGVH